jgi:hypothetical protein
MTTKQEFDTLGEAMQSIFGQMKAVELQLMRNPTPEHAEYQKKAREAMHDGIQSVRDGAYRFDGEAVFDSETIGILYNLTYALHDVVDGDKIGTLQAKIERLNAQVLPRPARDHA